MADSSKIFTDLPAALVENVLKKTAELGEKLLAGFEQQKKDRKLIRKRLEEVGLLIKDSSLDYPPLPTTCAVDGSYGLERLLTNDLAAAAAVAVEGLTPPSEQRYWETPRYKSIVFSEIHHEKTATILRSAMIGEELLLATKAPHSLVFLDFTLALPLIYLNQGFSAAGITLDLDVSNYLINKSINYLQAYRDILHSLRSDHQYIGIPKYSTKREISKVLGLPSKYDDRGLLTLILEAGELTKPLPMEKPNQQWHLTVAPLDKRRREAEVLVDEIIKFIQNIHVLYYKPHDWLPAFRIEIADSIAKNWHRLAIILHGIKHQCATPSIMEPYPLYLADRTVKALACALPAFRQITTQRIAEMYRGDIGEIYIAMHGYRTEEGR